MIIQTSRFGPLSVDDEKLIHFPEGILGFPSHQDYALVQTGDGSAFYWLQSVDRPELAFVVCDPRLFVADYQVPVNADELQAIGVHGVESAQVFIIVNKVNGMLTGNLQGPLVVNIGNRQARQWVLSDRRYGTRHPLMRLPEPVAMELSA